jgi:hypothetical protein
MSELAPSPTSIVWVNCPQCATHLPCHDPANSRYFGCGKCRTFFQTTPNDPASLVQRLDGFKQALQPGPSLLLGLVVELGGYRCRLTGYQVRGERDDRLAEWREYQLRPAEPLPGGEPADFPLQLAEYQGHWLLIRRAADFPGTPTSKPYRQKRWQDDVNNRTYQLWHRYRPVVRDALGEFEWNILEDEKLSIQEFISPPYLLAGEYEPSKPIAWYLAEYLEPAQVAATFGLAPAALPTRIGVGAAQPGPGAGEPQLRQLTVAGFLALFMLQLGLGFWRPAGFGDEQLTLSEPNAGATSTVLVSQPFDVNGPSALSINLESPDLLNHWVELTTSLVNEQTGRGYEFTRSLEYYEGVEDGEHWTEGDRSTQAILNSVPSGRYHLNFYPTLDKGAGPVQLRVAVRENPILWSNYFLALGALALLPLIVRWRRKGYEDARWENSDFGPASAGT